MKIFKNKFGCFFYYNFINFIYFKNKIFLKNFLKPPIVASNFIIHKNTKNIYQNLLFFKRISYFDKLVSLTFRKGLKLKIYNSISFSFKFFFYLFLQNNINLFSSYKNIYNIYYSFFNLTNIFFNINFLLFWLSSIIEPLFSLKCLSVPKKYRKKLKKKYIFNIFFLKKEKRSSVFLKWLYLNTSVYNDKVLEKKIIKSLIDIFLKNKKSNLYLKKIIINKKIFKKISY